MINGQWVLRNEDIAILLMKYVQCTDRNKTKAYTILKDLSGVSPIDGLMLLLNECAGIYLVECKETEDFDTHIFSINLFSNVPSICPFYWESETLTLFDMWISDIILCYTENDTEYDEIYYLLETLIYDIIGTLHLPLLNESNVSRTTLFSITHIRGEALIFSRPTFEEGY